jgi:hypothetical protein
MGSNWIENRQRKNMARIFFMDIRKDKIPKVKTIRSQVNRLKIIRVPLYSIIEKKLPDDVPAIFIISLPGCADPRYGC